MTIKLSDYCEDSILSTQLMEYYKWQMLVALLMTVTYYRIVKASLGKSTQLHQFNGQFEFKNNQVVPKNDDSWREQMALKSWNGVLLSVCSVMSTLRIIFRLLPIFYQSSCHVPLTLTQSNFPGATFAVTEAIMSLTVMAILF